MRRRSGRDSLWLLHHHRLFYKASGVAVPVGCDDEFRGYLERMVAVVRAECEAQGGSAKCARSGQLRTVYCYRMVEKKKVLKGWDQVCLFLPSGGQLGEGLSDLEIWRIERYFPVYFFLPHPTLPPLSSPIRPVCLSVGPSVYLSICLSVCLSVCLSMSLSVYPSFSLSVYRLTHLSLEERASLLHESYRHEQKNLLPKSSYTLAFFLLIVQYRLLSRHITT